MSNITNGKYSGVLSDIKSILTTDEIDELHRRIKDDWQLPNFRILISYDGKIYAIIYPLESIDSILDITVDVRDIIWNRFIRTHTQTNDQTQDDGVLIKCNKVSNHTPKPMPILSDMSGFKIQTVKLSDIMSPEEICDFYKKIAYIPGSDYDCHSECIMVTSSGQILFHRSPQISFASVLEVSAQLQHIIGKHELRRRLQEVRKNEAG